MRSIWKFTPSLIILALLTIGVTTHCLPLVYAGILSVCITVILVAFGVLEKNQYPYLLFAIALGMTFQVTLAGPYLIGSDVHVEYYWSQFYSGEDVWFPLRYYCPAAGMGAVIFAPMLQKVLFIPNLWTYKLVFPIFFALVPVVLYLLFNRWLDGKKAFIAVFMFIAFPAFLLEMPAIPESMLAELLLVIAIYLIIVEKFRLRYRIPLIIACGFLSGFVHYSTGFIMMIFLGCAFFSRIIFRTRNGIPHKVMAVICIIVYAGSFAFFATVADGAVMVKVSGIYNNWAPASMRLHTWNYMPANDEAPQPLPPANLPDANRGSTSYVPEKFKIAVPSTPPSEKTATEIVEMTIESPTEIVTIDASTGEVLRIEQKEGPKKVTPWFERYHDLMETTLGLDFMDVGIPGKSFRVLLWLVGLCYFLGLYAMRKNKEFWIFAVGAFVLVGACLLPRVSPILNASRFAHFALIGLAPLFILGGQFIFRSPKVLVVCLVIPYFLFTSGFIFEALKCEELIDINIPYSYSLSNHRIDLGEASVTENDVKVAEWIAENQYTFPLFADVFGQRVLNEMLGYRPDLMRAFYGHLRWMPKTSYYVFIRERNVRDEQLVIYAGIGQKDYYSFEMYNLDIEKNILFQSGDARVLYIEGRD